MAKIKKTQINEKLEDGTLQVIHPETDASVVIENDNKQFVTKSQKDDLNELIQMKETGSFGSISDVQDYDGNSLVENTIAKIPNYIKANEKGSNGGVATLDSNGKVPSSQLPSYVDDVLEYGNKSKFPSTGESGKIYVDMETNKTYRWSGTTYTEISSSLAIGETTGTAYDGAKGKKNAQDIESLKTQVSTVKSTANAAKLVADSLVNGDAKASKSGMADKFSSSKTITVSGDASGSVSTDFSTNPTITLTLSDSGVTAGTYSAVSVDEKGRVTAGGQTLEIGSTGQTTPSSTLVVGGLFFKEI